jgi:hypothetical protein
MPRTAGPPELVRRTLINIRVNQGEYDKLQELAAAAGYKNKRGSGVSAFLRDLALGNIVLTTSVAP